MENEKDVQDIRERLKNRNDARKSSKNKWFKTRCLWRKIKSCKL